MNKHLLLISIAAIILIAEIYYFYSTDEIKKINAILVSGAMVLTIVGIAIDYVRRRKN